MTSPDIRHAKRPGGRGVAPLAWVLVAMLAAHPAHGSTEEFSTFSVESQEEDDESLIDHLLAVPQRAWRDEWEHTRQGFRTGQGCLTSGQWMIESDLKLETALGDRARFGLDFVQSESDRASYEYMNLAFRFPTRWGVPGAYFRPFHDKSRQDFGATWDLGADTTVHQIQAVFTIEDAFNNLWAFRQTRVGDRAEPFVVHPYEPGLHVVERHESWRAEVDGRWLTPSRKHIPGLASTDPVFEETLWGTYGQGSIEVRMRGFGFEVGGYNKQARSTLGVIGDPLDNDDWRRQWHVEAIVRHGIGPVAAEVRYFYQGRDQIFGPPVTVGAFHAIDRVGQLDLRWQALAHLVARAGGLYDRITVDRHGNLPTHSYGTRNESRAYLGLDVRFGRVLVSGVEGIELDPEPYVVALGFHDKGFLQLQTSF